MSINISRLSYSYEGKEVLHDINLTVDTGESVGIVGSSGCGKSTLLKLVSGLYELQNGELTVEGFSAAADIRKCVAMVMQNNTLLPVSIRDNITCGHAMSEEQIEAAVKAAQLSEWINELPEGLNTYVGERGGHVSGGQAQRIAIARAIAKNTEVILLDEATSALDHDTGAAFIDAIRELTKGKTVIHISHKPETLRDCSRIYELRDGTLRMLDNRYWRNYENNKNNKTFSA